MPARPNLGRFTPMRNRKVSTEFEALIAAIRAEGIANRREEVGEDRGKRLREWITIVLLAMTLAAISWQVHEMIKVYGPIRDQADAQTRAAEAEKQAAEAGKKQSENAERALTLGQRAWVGPQNAAFASEPEQGKPLELTVQYQNTGREPALSFVYSVNVTALLDSQERKGNIPAQIQDYMNGCRNMREWQGGSVVYPTAFANYTLTDKTNAKLVDKAVISGDKIIVVQGCFAYTTMGMPKYSYFCWFYRHGATKIQNLNICASGHDAD